MAVARIEYIVTWLRIAPQSQAFNIATVVLKKLFK